MEKTYQPENIEQHWYRKWEQSSIFAPTFAGAPYCIMLPPPNVTGTLHMGHGFQVSLMDALIRYHRMQGYNTLWQAGTDHAGIATQMVVELQLKKEGLDRQTLGRTQFIDRMWQWKEQSDGTIKQQLRRMGASVDWNRERFSLDEGLSDAVLTAFIRLYEEGLIYRGQRLVNWDPVLKTAISDLEVITAEELGSLWYIRYPLVKGTEQVMVATTRPETLFGDAAVAVHPADTRYQHLIGQLVHLPLTHRTIPIIADDSIVPEFGTGCVKITPAHDFHDYAIGERHHLIKLNILTPTATLNDQVPAPYQGLDRFVARKKIIADLNAQGLLVKTEPHPLNVPKGERSGAVIEPYLANQWFIKAGPLAEPAIAAVKSKQIEFVPASWTKIYLQWLENIQDWCISRQLWWGHRIPAWYDDQGNTYVGKSEADVRARYRLDTQALQQDEDVLDTWFSSALWPFATLGWPEPTRELHTFYPTSVLVTGFDIIFFWVARMVMMSLKLNKVIPFRTVYVTGLVRDSEGQKMSKSKGNILDPIDLIDGISLPQLLQKRTQNLIHAKDAAHIVNMTTKEFPTGIPAYGTDSLRFTYYALASTGRDVRFDLGRIEGYRHFCNKLWNAARFVLMNTENHPLYPHTPPNYSLADQWIQSRLQVTIQKVHQAFQEYRFDILAQTVYEFVWNEYCDWYLELSKTILYNSQEEATQRGTQLTLLTVLETLLRLLHPLIPFITEEIWQRVAGVLNLRTETIMQQPYPTYNANAINTHVNDEMEWLKRVVLAIRNIRGEMNIMPNKTITLVLKETSPLTQSRVERMMLYIKPLAKIATFSWTQVPPVAAATAFVDDLELFMPLADLVDKHAEIARLSKEMNKLENELNKSHVKLTNPSYLAKAPPHVITAEKQKAAEGETSLNKLRARLHMIEGI